MDQPSSSVLPQLAGVLPSFHLDHVLQTMYPGVLHQYTSSWYWLGVEASTESNHSSCKQRQLKGLSNAVDRLLYVLANNLQSLLFLGFVKPNDVFRRLIMSQHWQWGTSSFVGCSGFGTAWPQCHCRFARLPELQTWKILEVPDPTVSDCIRILRGSPAFSKPLIHPRRLAITSYHIHTNYTAD